MRHPVEAAVELAEHRLGCQDSAACGSKLDGKRQAVQAAADFGNRIQVFNCELEFMVLGLGTLGK